MVFNDLCCLIFAALQTRKVYLLFFNISGLQCKKELNSINCEKSPTIVKTESIVETPKSLKQHQTYPLESQYRLMAKTGLVHFGFCKMLLAFLKHEGQF